MLYSFKISLTKARCYVLFAIWAYLLNAAADREDIFRRSYFAMETFTETNLTNAILETWA